MAAADCNSKGSGHDLDDLRDALIGARKGDSSKQEKLFKRIVAPLRKIAVQFEQVDADDLVIVAANAIMTGKFQFFPSMDPMDWIKYIAKLAMADLRRAYDPLSRHSRINVEKIRQAKARLQKANKPTNNVYALADEAHLSVQAVRNALLTSHKKASDEHLNCVASDINVHHELRKGETAQIVANAIIKLSSTERQVIILLYGEELSYEETARRMGILPESPTPLQRKSSINHVKHLREKALQELEKNPLIRELG